MCRQLAPVLQLLQFLHVKYYDSSKYATLVYKTGFRNSNLLKSYFENNKVTLKTYTPDVKKTYAITASMCPRFSLMAVS